MLFILRYHEIFFMIDTCQASSMYEKFYSPNILAMASSLVGEDSLSVRDLSITFYYRIIQNDYNTVDTTYQTHRYKVQLLNRFKNSDFIKKNGGK